MIKPYEAIIVFNPEIADDKVDATIVRLEKKIKDNKGTDIVTTKWGKKKLPFRMTKNKKLTEGNYVYIKFKGDSLTPNELRSTLNVTEEVIRHSIHIEIDTEPRRRDEPVQIEPSMIAEQGPTGANG